MIYNHQCSSRHLLRRDVGTVWNGAEIPLSIQLSVVCSALPAMENIAAAHTDKFMTYMCFKNECWSQFTVQLLCFLQTSWLTNFLWVLSHLWTALCGKTPQGFKRLVQWGRLFVTMVTIFALVPLDSSVSFDDLIGWGMGSTCHTSTLLKQSLIRCVKAVSKCQQICHTVWTAVKQLSHSETVQQTLSSSSLCRRTSAGWTHCLQACVL